MRATTPVMVQISCWDLVICSCCCGSQAWPRRVHQKPQGLREIAASHLDMQDKQIPLVVGSGKHPCPYGVFHELAARSCRHFCTAIPSQITQGGDNTPLMSFIGIH
jgi:hypothetical protein